MADRSFEEFIDDLLGQGMRGMRVYVSTGQGAHIYHYSRSCLEGSPAIKTDSKVRRVPVELVEWLGYAKCRKYNCKPDK